MTVFPQAALEPGVVRITIDVPSGSSIDEANEMMQVAGGSARFVGYPTEAIPLWVHW